jgi:MYXO-CTERM domain-containing protein
VIHPGGPDPDKTLVEVTPDTLEADGFSEAVITATLVDEFNNPLTLDSDPVNVVFEITSGKLLEKVKRNPTTGLYEQTLRAPNEGGTATITATIEGFDGDAQTNITFMGQPGCSCRTTQDAPVGAMPWGAWVLVFGGWAIGKRRRS